jgi:hypothetical protein
MYFKPSTPAPLSLLAKLTKLSYAQLCSIVVWNVESHRQFDSSKSTMSIAAHF